MGVTAGCPKFPASLAAAMSHHHNIHSSNGFGAQVIGFLGLSSPPPNAILTMTFSGQYDQFGCGADCGCVPNAPRIPAQYFVPPEAEQYTSLTELNELITSLNSILATNYVPPLPLLFTHFCIPFLPICILSYYASRTEKRLDEFIETANKTTYLHRNCHWERTHHPTQVRQLIMPSIYLIKHPDRAAVAEASLSAEKGAVFEMAVTTTAYPSAGSTLVAPTYDTARYHPVSTTVPSAATVAPASIFGSHAPKREF